MKFTKTVGYFLQNSIRLRWSGLGSGVTENSETVR